MNSTLIATLKVLAVEKFYHGTGSADEILKTGFNVLVSDSADHHWLFNEYIMEDMLKEKGIEADADEMDDGELLDLWLDHFEEGVIIFVTTESTKEQAKEYGDVLEFTPPKDAVRLNTAFDDVHGVLFYYPKTIPGKYFTDQENSDLVTSALYHVKRY
jgi:hypothetical protein